MLDLSDRLFDAIENQTPTNCIGTALFLTGIVDKDKYLDSDGVKREILPNLKRLEQPEEGAIVTWENDTSVIHMGVVVSINPLLLTHRLGCYRGANAMLIERDNFEKVSERIWTFFFYGEIKIRYYKPSIEIIS